MNREWTFSNISRKSPPVGVDSLSTTIEQIVDLSRQKLGETVEYHHFREGSIVLTAGNGCGTLSFSPKHSKSFHSTLDFQTAVPTEVLCDRLQFVDDTNTVSYIDSASVLPILDVIRGLVYLLEHHEFAPFLNWEPGC
jgi:hypothetical protein